MQTPHRWNKENPGGYRAHNILHGMINRGKITREPCALCAAQRSTSTAATKDYARPLDVVWLCAKCHLRVRVTFPELSANKPRCT